MVGGGFSRKCGQMIISGGGGGGGGGGVGGTALDALQRQGDILLHLLGFKIM
jgi:hypothetical protein